MKSIYKIPLYFSTILLVLALIVLPANAVLAEENEQHQPITQELIRLMEDHPEIQSMLEASLAKAKEVNTSLRTNPVQSLSGYYAFIDWMSTFQPHPHMLQDLCYFYFLIDQPLPELEHMGLYKNAIQYYPPFAEWVRDFADAWADFLNSEDSWSEIIYREFYDDPRYGLQKGWYESPANWHTFNQFFPRHLKTPGERPIAKRHNPAVVVSPADSVPQGVWPIDGNSYIEVDCGLQIKNKTYYSIGDLLAEDSQYREAFANGVLTHTFLNVFDYHRYHFAVGGEIVELNYMTRNCALEVEWDPELDKYVPLDSTGWQFSQTLAYVIVDTGKYGLVALIPMGMAQVSSCNIEPGLEVGDQPCKGDKLGYFLFGGSDFIMLFQEEANFEITASLEEDGEDYKHILMGEEYGIMKGPSNWLSRNYWWIIIVAIVLIIGAVIVCRFRVCKLKKK